jgi:hypothetical protein
MVVIGEKGQKLSELHETRYSVSELARLPLDNVSLMADIWGINAEEME